MPEKHWWFDTVSFSNFLLSNSAYILERRYRGRGMITWEVYDELSAGFAEYPCLKQAIDMVDHKVIVLTSLSKKAHQAYLGMIGQLGKGEASCIAAAKEQSGIVVTDDRAARKMCRQLNIPMTGSVGILKASVLEGLISPETADQHLQEMINAGFYSPVSKISDIM